MYAQTRSLVQSASGAIFQTPPWLPSSPIFGVVARVPIWSRRSPVIQPSSVASARPSGSTYRTPQHSVRFSIDS